MGMRSIFEQITKPMLYDIILAAIVSAAVLVLFYKREIIPRLQVKYGHKTKLFSCYYCMSFWLIVWIYIVKTFIVAVSDHVFCNPVYGILIAFCAAPLSTIIIQNVVYDRN